MNPAMKAVIILLTVYFGVALSSPAPAALSPETPSAPLGTESEQLLAPAGRALRAPGSSGDLDTANTFGIGLYGFGGGYPGYYGGNYGYGYGYPSYGGYYGGGYRYPYSGYYWG